MVNDRSLHAFAAVSALMLLGSAGVAAAAEPTGFGSAAFQGVRYCRDAPNGGGNVLAADIGCFDAQNPDQFRKQTVITGGDGVAVDSAFETIIGGRMAARVLFGELDLPVIKGGAWADDDTRVASTIATYMGFTYEGPAPTAYALDALFDWTDSGAPLGIADALAGASPAGEFGGEGGGGFNIYLMDGTNFPTFTTAGQITNYFGGIEGCGSAGVLGAAYASLSKASAGYGEGSVTLNTSCSGGGLTLAPGGKYVLATLFQTVANRNGFIDATNTVRVQLSDELSEEVKQTLIENVVTARSLVPEPTSWAMLIAGFGLVGATMRRRRTALA